MSTPSARYIIAADDRTKSALKSIQTGFRDMDRNVKGTLKGLNTVLGIFVGVQLKQGFQQILRATEASAAGQRGFAQALGEVRTAAKDLLAAKGGLPEATKELQALRDVLKDPGIVAAADALTSSLIRGFGQAAIAVAKFAGGARQVLLQLGMGDPVTQQEIIDSKSRKLDNNSAEISRLRASQSFSGKDSNFARESAARIQLLERENSTLMVEIDRLQGYDPGSVRGPRGRYARSTAMGKAIGTAGAGAGKGGTAKTPDDGLIVAVTSQRRSTSAIEEFYEDLEESTRTSVQKQVAEFERLKISVQDLVGAGRITQEDGINRIDEVLGEMLTGVEVTSKRTEVALGGLSEFALQASRNMQDSFADFLFDPFEDGLKGMAKSFVDTLRRMAAEAAAAQVFGALFGGGGGKAGGGGSLAPGKTILSEWMGGLLGGIFGGARAAGGPVSAGKAYLVGERGPELFAPGSSGSIIPNGKTGGATIHITNSIDARGATADLAQALPAILAENNRRMYDELDRRYGIR